MAETASTKNVEWKIDLTQQQLFSVFNVNAKEILASRDNVG
jgi:hypothetical protein